VSQQVGPKTRLNAALHLSFISKETWEKRALVSQLCRVQARASTGRTEERNSLLSDVVFFLGEKSDGRRKLHDT
jgi:hypothetical protein